MGFSTNLNRPAAGRRPVLQKIRFWFCKPKKVILRCIFIQWYNIDMFHTSVRPDFIENLSKSSIFSFFTFSDTRSPKSKPAGGRFGKAQNNQPAAGFEKLTFFWFFKKIFFSTCVMIKQTSKMSFSHNLLPMTTRVHQNMTFWLSYEPWKTWKTQIKIGL